MSVGATGPIIDPFSKFCGCGVWEKEKSSDSSNWMIMRSRKEGKKDMSTFAQRLSTLMPRFGLDQQPPKVGVDTTPPAPILGTSRDHRYLKTVTGTVNHGGGSKT